MLSSNLANTGPALFLLLHCSGSAPVWVQSVPWCESWLQLIFSQLTEYACNANQPQQTVQIARKVCRDGTTSRSSHEVKPVGKDQDQNQGSKRVALVNQQCGQAEIKSLSHFTSTR